MAQELQYEPNVRKQWLISILDELSNPNIQLESLKSLVQSDAIPYVWRWQDDIEGHYFKEPTSVTEPLKRATANLIHLLGEIIERNGLPKVTERAVPIEALSEDAKRSPSPDSRPTHSFRDNNDSNEPMGPTNSTDGETRTGESTEHREGRRSVPKIHNAANDCNMLITSKFCRLPSSDADFCSAALAFLFHAADGSGGAMYNLSEAVDFTLLGRVTCSLLYAANLNTSMSAVRVLGQVIGASHYYPPTSVPHLLLSMAMNVPCHNGSSTKASSVSLVDFITGDCTVDDILIMLDKDVRTTEPDLCHGSVITCFPHIMAKLRVRDCFDDAEQRSFLVSQQSYSVAALMILIGEHGFDRIVTTRAPNALNALVDVCRDTYVCPTFDFVKSSIVESLTIFLSFLESSHNARIFKRLQLAQLLSEIYNPRLNEGYFYQLCDLASFAPSQTMTSPLKLIQLSMNHDLSGEGKLRALDVLARTFDPPLFNNSAVPDQMLEPVYSELYASLEHDLNALLADVHRTERPGDLKINSKSKVAQHDSQRYYQLVTERLEVLTLFISPLSWTNVERTVLKSTIIERLISILAAPELMETLPTRALCLAAEILFIIFGNEQARVLLLDELEIKYQLYDAVVYLARAQNRALDLLKVIETLHKCLWGKKTFSLESTGENDYNTGAYYGNSDNEETDNEETDMDPIENEHHQHDNSEADQENRVSELDIAHMRMATNVVVDSFSRHMEHLMLSYTTSAAKECIASFVSIVKNTAAHKVDITNWIFRVVKSYFCIADRNGDKATSFGIDGIINSLYNVNLLNTCVGELLLKRVVLSTGHQFIGVFSRLRSTEVPEFTEGILRLTVELAIESSPISFIRLLHYANLLAGEPLKFATRIIPLSMISDLMVKFVDEINIWTHSDHEDFSFATHMASPELFCDIIRRITALTRHISPVNRLEIENYKDTVSKKENVLQLLVELYSSSHKEGLRVEGAQFAIEMVTVAVEKNESESILSCLQSLMKPILEYPALASESIGESLNKLKKTLSSNLGLETLRLFNWIFSTTEKHDMLINEIRRDFLCTAMDRSEETTLRVISDLPPKFISENGKLLAKLLMSSIKRISTYQSDVAQKEGSNKMEQWLDLSTNLAIQLTGNSEFESNRDYFVLLSESANTLIEMVSNRKLLMPQTFSTLHALLINALNVDVMIDLMPGSSIRSKTDGSLTNIPPALSGMPKQLPNSHVLERFIKISLETLQTFIEELNDEEIDSVKACYQLGIIGITFVNSIIVQSDPKLAETAIDFGIVTTYTQSIIELPQNLKYVIEECLLNICHVLTTSPAVMAKILIEQLNDFDDNGFFHIHGTNTKDSAVSPTQAILFRRPEFQSIVNSNYGVNSSGAFVPWYLIESGYKNSKLDLMKPKPLDVSTYPTLSNSSQKQFITTLVDMLLNPTTPTHGAICVKVLIDLSSTCGQVRRLILGSRTSFVEKVLIQFGTQNLPNSHVMSDKSLASEMLPLIISLLSRLTCKAKDEYCTSKTRRHLEKATKFVMGGVLKILEGEIPRRKLENPDEAVALLFTCTELVEAVWGDSHKLLTDLPLITKFHREKDGTEFFYQSIIREMKVIETLIGTFALFHLAWNDLQALKFCALKFIDRLIFQELFKLEVGNSRPDAGKLSFKAENGQSGFQSLDSDLEEADVEDYDDDDDDLNDEDLMEADVAEEHRIRHRQRIEASHGNTFRNSSLGEYESSSGSESTELSEEDNDIIEGEDDGIIIDDNHVGSGHAMDTASESEANTESSGFEPELEIMLVLSADDSDNIGYSGDESVEESSASGESSEESASESSQTESGMDSGSEQERFDIILGSDQDEGENSIEITYDAPEGFESLPNLGIDDEILLLYSDRMEDGQDDFGSQRNSQIRNRSQYFRSTFSCMESAHNAKPLLCYGAEGTFIISENSNLIWDWPNLPLELEREVKNADFLEQNARHAAQDRFSLSNEKVRNILDNAKRPSDVSFCLKTENDVHSSFFPQLLALLTRVCFTDAFDTEFGIIIHSVVTLAGIPAGRQLFSTLIHVLSEASCGHIDSVYASITRIVASGSPVPLSSALAIKIPFSTTPALVCHNVLSILEVVFSGEPIVEDPRFLFNKNNGELCEYEDCESDFLDDISSMAKDVLKRQGTNIIGLVSRPVVARNKKLLELASSVVEKIITASKDGWDPTAPSDTLHDEDESPHNRNDGNELIQFAVDGNLSARLIEVLSSKECNYRVFSSITRIVKKNTSTHGFVDPLIKDLRKAKYTLIAGLRKLVENHSNTIAFADLDGHHKLFEDQLHFLRLLNIVGVLFSDEECLKLFQKVDLTALWNRVIRTIEVIQHMEGLLPEFTLSLLEVVAMPGDIIFREHDSILSKMADDETEIKVSNSLNSFIEDTTNTLQSCMQKYSSIINELIRAKPNLLGGPLGAMALKFKVVDFKNKCDWLNQEICHYRDHKYAEDRHTCVINRNNVFDDSFEVLSKLEGNELLYPMNVEFEDEPGVDEGGVAREWYEILSREILNPMYGLFRPTHSGSSIYQINPVAEGNPDKEDVFRFVGRVIGRAIYDQYTVGLYFSRVIYKYFLGETITLADMESVDESYYKSLKWMLDNDITDVFFETFSVEVTKFGVTETIDLIPNGRNIPVDESNKHHYIKRIVEYKLVDSVLGALEAMKEGLYDVLLEMWVKTFTDQELELLISGLPSIDIDDWYQNTEYEGYNPSSRQVRWFWLAVKSFSPELRAKLLQFSTGTSRVPAQGFGHLESNTDSGKFFIHMEKGSTDRLPSAHTCMNQISIPEYESYGKLRKLLLKAITEGSEGFGFV